MEYYTFATNIISLSNLGILCVEKQQDLNLDIRCSSSMMKIIKKYADVARFLGNLHMECSSHWTQLCRLLRYKGGIRLLLHTASVEEQIPTSVCPRPFFLLRSQSTLLINHTQRSRSSLIRVLWCWSNRNLGQFLRVPKSLLPVWY